MSGTASNGILVNENTPDPMSNAMPIPTIKGFRTLYEMIFANMYVLIKGRVLEKRIKPQLGDLLPLNRNNAHLEEKAKLHPKPLECRLLKQKHAQQEYRRTAKNSQ